MGLITLGINHEQTPISIREKINLPVEIHSDLLKDLKNHYSVSEAALVNTCNRTELYLETTSIKPIVNWLKTYPELKYLEPKILLPYAYIHREQFAVQHMLRVASGLDSMVLGEVEILGQLKKAYCMANDAGSIGKYLNKLFQFAFAVAKKVRTETAISVHPISIAYTAVKLAKHIFADLSKSRVLILGAGETARLLILHLQNLGVKDYIIANRTLTKAQELEQYLTINNKNLQVKAITLNQVNRYFASADIVIGATGSPLPIIGKGLVERALKIRRRKPICLVDIAVPRDIEPEVSELSDVYLYCIDDLKELVSENQAARRCAAEQAEAIIKEQVTKFMEWIHAQNYISTLCEFRSNVNVKKNQLLTKALRALDAGIPAEQVLKKFGHSLMQQFLHVPTVAIRQASFSKDQKLIEIIRNLYDLDGKNYD